MNSRRTSLVALSTLLLLAGIAGCGVARSGNGGGGPGGDNDTGTLTMPGDDAAVISPGDDAWVPPVGDDAATVDDPLNAAPICTSGRMWRFGNTGSSAMNPGLACISCHDTEPRAPGFTAAGTVYPTGHEPDLCNGIGGSSVTIDITDSTGNTVSVSPNSAGNFYYQGGLVPPITAAVHYMGRTRTMITPAASGDCNSCHTQDGTMAAPGRITLP